MTDTAAPVPGPTEALPARPAADPLAPYDAVLLLSYGGPRRPEDVLPFMRNATAGRGVPDSRLLEVSGHYQGFGGASPINARNAELRDALQARLAERALHHLAARLLHQPTVMARRAGQEGREEAYRQALELVWGLESTGENHD